jgi:hypothetical protein
LLWLVSGEGTLGNIKLKKLGLFSQIYAHCQQPSMLISSGWALKKCFETVKKEAMILKEQASKGTDLLT